MSADRYRGLQLQIEGQAESIRELEADIAAKVEEIRAVTQLCERPSAELVESTEAHDHTKAKLTGVERDLEGTKTKLQVLFAFVFEVAFPLCFRAFIYSLSR